MQARAVVIEGKGGVDVLRIGTLELREPGPGEVLVEVAAAGLNFIEVYQRTGLYPVPLPATPGGEGAGVVTALGPDVKTLRVGDRVASVNFAGAYAEAVDADQKQQHGRGNNAFGQGKRGEVEEIAREGDRHGRHSA